MEMGYEYLQVKDFIEDKGLAEYNLETFCSNVDNPHYNNTLYKKEEE